MSELPEAGHLLERAEQAAMSGDFASADELLKGAARIQEEELGPHHPDLANTLNNLAVVAERLGRIAEAKTLYRRAAGIAAAALPSDHPMVVESRQNFADFCRAHGLPTDVREAVTPTKAAPPPVVTPPPDPGPPAPVASQPLPSPVAGKESHSLRWLAAGAVLVVVVVLLVSRPWSSHETSTPVGTPEPGAAPTAESVPRPTTAPPDSSATERKEPPKAAARDRDRQLATAKPAAPAAITLAIAQVCRGFSTSGGNWRCDPVSSSTKPGPIVLYTRVKSPRDTAVVHRWYRGNTLRQSVKLGIRGNATEGYRTYSRQTVSEGDWRVEIRSADGTLLHEERFVVR